MAKILKNFAIGLGFGFAFLAFLYLSGAYINISARVFHGTNKAIKSAWSLINPPHYGYNQTDTQANIAADATNAVANVEIDENTLKPVDINGIDADLTALEATESDNTTPINSISSWPPR